MINRKALLADLQSLLRSLEADLRERADSADVPEVRERLEAEYNKARDASRTAQNYEDWLNAYLTQIAAAWVLSCVFVRFLEDNQLIDPPKIAGPDDRLQRAWDEHELYFRTHPTQTDRDYLLNMFDELARLPGGGEVFGPHNPIHELPNWLGPDVAGELLRFFQKRDANTGELVHDFTDPEWDTRFLGDLYQDLSEAARKRYALLQTPEFVEEFILDRTLDPALDEFGLTPPPVLNQDGDRITEAGFRMIDPACGSGHFLLGAFHRILDRWRRKEPAAKDRDLVQRALNSVYGVDVNPYAIAIARFRLLLAALRESGITRLKDAPAFHFNLAAGDSLLHGATLDTGSKGAAGPQDLFAFHELAHHYASEDANELHRILRPGSYHAVVANPPYITVKDRALSHAYRHRYATCHMKYSLSVPFMERIFRLAVQGRRNGGATSAGYTGQITSNSFMKREFGKKLIEKFLPHVELTHVIDASGAYIPGHGTPTVILFGRHGKPIAGEIRAVMGIRGEPSTPDDAAQGFVWSAICNQIDQPGSESEFVSVMDMARQKFSRHPWSIGGGGAAELKDLIDSNRARLVQDLQQTHGFGVVIGETEIFQRPWRALLRQRASLERVRPIVQGDAVRDWAFENDDSVVYPYGSDVELSAEDEVREVLWPYRTTLYNRPDFSGMTYRECGRTYWEYHQIPRHPNAVTRKIVYPAISSHNHFALNEGRSVFRETAPLLTLTDDTSGDNYLALLGLLNSSTACFWMKQVCHQKQMTGGDGIRVESKAKVPFAFNATALAKLPIPPAWEAGPLREKLIDLTRRMSAVAAQIASRNARIVIAAGGATAAGIRSRWEDTLARRRALRAEQVVLQEAIDFTVYAMFDLSSSDLIGSAEVADGTVVTEGDRPFCILAQSNEDGFAVPKEVPAEWPADLRHLWEARAQAVDESRELKLIESAMYKRRWIGRQGLFNHQRSENELKDAAEVWLLDRLESYFDFDGRMNDDAEPTAKVDIALVSVAKLADIARQDEQFLEVGELYRDDPAFDVQALVAELVEAESVPLLPVLRYKPSGLRKRAEWEKTWDLQRAEDAIDARTKLPADDPEHLSEGQAERLKKQQVGDIPVPPKYKSSDFLKSTYWRLRGKLDVPKERWVSFPHCEGPDGSLLIAWAGYDHLQLAQAIGAHYADVQERLGGQDDPRLEPLLSALIELLPWLKQWHNQVDPQYQAAMGDYFEGFINEEARRMDKTVDEVRQWQPPKRTRRRKKQRVAK